MSAILSTLLLLSGVANEVWAEEACGDGGGGSKDIDALTANFDEASGDITVKMTLCADPDTNNKTIPITVNTPESVETIYSLETIWNLT